MCESQDSELAERVAQLLEEDEPPESTKTLRNDPRTQVGQ